MRPGAAAPSTSNVGPLAKGRAWHGYLRNHRDRKDIRDAHRYLADVEEYGSILQTHCNRGLGGTEVLEVGFGTRASRLAVLSAAGASPVGVDVEVPLLRLRPSTLWSIFTENGAERLGKSVARHLLFDRAASRRLREALVKKYSISELDYGRLEVCDAADLELPDGSLDLVLSEDVFEHMTPDSIAHTLENIRRWLKPGAIALIRPNVFTGISGGHLAEWTVDSVRDRPGEARRGAPWEHLRAQRFAPNTYLNRFSRADYRAAFAAARFEILEERCRYPELGVSLMTLEIRRELSAWPDEELFSNQTMFVLRPV